MDIWNRSINNNNTSDNSPDNNSRAERCGFLER